MKVHCHLSFISGLAEHYLTLLRRNYGMSWRILDPRKPVLPVNTKYSWPKSSRFEKISGVKNMRRFYTPLIMQAENYLYSLQESKAELKVFFFVNLLTLELIFFGISKERLEVQSIGLFQAKEECSKLKVRVLLQ